jgi:DNA-binding CsgD family transcriptional regulator
MELLWPHLGRRAASNNLRRTLHATRRVLDPSESSRYLVSEEGWLALCPAGALRVAVGFQHIPEEDAWREPYLAAARSRLDEASWAEAWVEGRTMSMEQAIDYALSEQKLATPPSLESEQSSSDGPSSLTRREKEIAILVSRGLTNRSIANELVLSEHTVHHHVTNILKKLNLSSRQQVDSHLPDR